MRRRRLGDVCRQRDGSAKAAVRVGHNSSSTSPVSEHASPCQQRPMTFSLVDFYFNGQPSDQGYWHQQVTSAAAINVPTFYDCVTVPYTAPFAQRLLPATANRIKGFQLPWINWVQAKYTINVRQQLADLNINVFTLDMPVGDFSEWVSGRGHGVDPTDGISVIGYANNISFDAQDR